MHGHPSSDRFIRDSGATIMATGYVYARLRSRDPLSSRRDGMHLARATEAVSWIITIVFAARPLA